MVLRVEVVEIGRVVKLVKAVEVLITLPEVVIKKIIVA